jgi:uncharacterized protein involved in response to NO
MERDLAGVWSRRVEAYRYLFPVGGVYALIGGGVWALHGLGLLAEYPSAAHPALMTGGFLFSCALGFLWTALPRFLGVPLPTFAELFPVIAVMGALTCAPLSVAPTLLYAAALWSFGITAAFVAGRYRRRTKDLLQPVWFVAVGLATGIAASAALLLHDLTDIPAAVVSIARSFYYRGTMLFFVAGIGMRLIPALAGVNPAPAMQTIDLRAAGKRRLPDGKAVELALLAAGIIAAFVIEGLGEIRAGAALMAVVMVWVSTRGFSIHRLPQRGMAFQWGVWLAGWATVAAPVAAAVFPEHYLHAWHILFIVGFGLLTPLVALRVALSHGGYDPPAVERRGVVRWIIIVLLTAAATRVSVAFIPQTALNHYAYAAGLWCVAIGLWLAVMLRHLRPAGKPPAPEAKA